MARPKKKSQTKEEILRKKRENERKRYARIKKDPEKLAAYKEKDKQKYLKQRTTGVRKIISEMTEREKRQCRKAWRERSSTYYKKKCAAKKASTDFMRANTPSSLCDEVLIRDSLTPQVRAIQSPSAKQSHRLTVARQRSITQRRKRNKELKDKEEKIKTLQAKLNKYRKKVSKLQKQKEKLKSQVTPNSKMTQMAENPATRAEVVKKALFGDIIEQQITENMTNLKTRQEKQIANKLLLGSVVKQRKIWKTNKKFLTYKKIWNAKKQKTKNKEVKRCLAKLVQEFLEDDKYSRLGAGKKEYIKRKNIKKQKRYRLDTLRNLHKEFLKTGTVIISYSMFARLTPFWIISPKATDRDTCMCVMHSNFQLLITALHKAKILKVSSYQNLLNEVCCNRYDERCLERTCDDCCTKPIPLSEDINNAMPVKYQQWESIRETISDPKTKKERMVIKQKKTTSEIITGDLIQKLKDALDKIFRHQRNIVHQYQSMKNLKESLTEKDAVVHMDFSENYSTKYSEEIQSFHFGGSRAQISLHTVVVYLHNSTRSYCTASTNLSHGVPAIWAHLQPVLEELPAKIENIHFVSDGPVTQYRNKLMFYILACKISEMWPKFITWTWNYHEAGHGKGAPDGVGATCKRTADSVVASGGDVMNMTQFCGAIQNRCPNITLFIVTDNDIEKMEAFLSREQPSLKVFKGTLQVHQVQGNAYFPQKVVMKSLSCFCSNECEHFRMGFVKYCANERAKVDDIFGESDSERGNNESPSIINLQNMTDDVMSLTSDLMLNIDDPDNLLEMPNIDIDPKELFLEQEKRRETKRKLKENVRLDKKQLNKKTKADKKIKEKTKKKELKKSKTNVANKENKFQNESDDYSCIICGVLYMEDKSGQDWIQCISCREWAQIKCIKTDPVSFNCPECLPDGDYEP